MAKLVTIYIYGATGAQGGSVAQALLQDKAGSFSVRGITHDPSCERARNLADSGVDVVRADGLDRQSLVAAFRGSWGVFANTNSDDSASSCFSHSIGEEGLPSETDAGRNIVDAAVEAGVQVFVYGGMASPREITKGAVTAQAFEARPNKMFLDPGKDHGARVQGMSQSRGIDRFGDDFQAGKLIRLRIATGKKARYVPVEDWRSFETYGMRALETVRDMFGFVQLSGGLYHGEPNDAAVPAALKAVAAGAQGKTGEETELMTLERFFKVQFG